MRLTGADGDLSMWVALSCFFSCEYGWPVSLPANIDITNKAKMKRNDDSFGSLVPNFSLTQYVLFHPLGSFSACI
jgi:hypothetical protein